MEPFPAPCNEVELVPSWSLGWKVEDLLIVWVLARFPLLYPHFVLAKLFVILRFPFATSCELFKASSISCRASCTSSLNWSCSSWASCLCCSLLALNSSTYFLIFSLLHCNSLIVSRICWRVDTSPFHPLDVGFLWFLILSRNKFFLKIYSIRFFNMEAGKFDLAPQWMSICSNGWGFWLLLVSPNLSYSIFSSISYL